MVRWFFTVNVAVCLACLVLAISASKIVFEAIPSNVMAKLSRTLKLRCCINDTNTGSKVITDGSMTVVGRRDVTTTAEDMDKVSSIVIMHGGIEIASIKDDGAKNLVNSGNLHVVGNLTAQHGERGCIEVTIDHPSTDEGGEYVCEANAIDSVGHNVMFVFKQEVSVTTPSVLDLIDYIHVLENEVKHTETGVIQCGDSTKDWHGRTYHDITTSYQRPYNSPPTVQIGLVGDILYHNSPDRYNVHVTDVNEHNFTVRCETWSDSQVYSMSVSWISVPN